MTQAQIFSFGLIFLINLIRILKFAVLARVLLSWIQPRPTNRIGQILHQVTDPLFQPVRKLMPNLGMLDLSPLIIYFGLSLLQGWLTSL